MKDQIELLQKYIADGYLTVQKHPTFELFIYNYTQKTQYESFWNPLTLACRGLILDSEYNYVARPFGKFFNYSELEASEIPALGFDIYEKMDGSMGVLYFANGKPFISTRGSFQSEQAIKANEMLYNRYFHTHEQLNPSFTYVFEIIYPENKIVVDYQGMEDLILLAIIDTQTGHELPIKHIGFPVINTFDAIQDFDVLKKLNWKNKEGFVVRFHNNFRMKIKFDEYLRLKRILTQISSKMIWEHLKNGKDLSLFLEEVPDEFFAWVKSWEQKLKKQFEDIEDQCLSEHMYFLSRKQAADYFLASEYSSVLFKIYDMKPYDDLIWKLIEPPFEKPQINFDS